MMEEKCFCHFNGYKVKDADARSEIETIKNTYATTDYVNEAVANVNVDLTGYATEEYVNNRTPEPTTLFDNAEGTSETITLSESIDNFSYIEIYFKHGDSHHYTKTISKECKVCLEGSYINVTDNIEWTQFALVLLSGTSITWSESGAFKHSLDGHALEGTHSTKILRVIGIK